MVILEISFVVNLGLDNQYLYHHKHIQLDNFYRNSFSNANSSYLFKGLIKYPDIYEN